MKKVKKIISVILVISLCFTGSFISDCFTKVGYAKKSKVSNNALKLNKSRVVLVEGKTVKLKITSKLSKSGKKSVMWKTSRKSIASVSKKGVVKANKKGSTKITAFIKGTKKKVSCTVKVINKKANASSSPASNNLNSQTLDNSVTSPINSDVPEASVTPENSNSPEATLSPSTKPSPEQTKVPVFPNDTASPGTTSETTSSPGSTQTPAIVQSAAPAASPTQTPAMQATTSPIKTPVVQATINPTKTPSGQITTSPTKTPVVQATINPTKTPVVQTTTVPTETPIVNDLDADATAEDVLPVLIGYQVPYKDGAPKRTVTKERISLSADKKSVIFKLPSTWDIDKFNGHLSYEGQSLVTKGMYQSVSYSYSISGDTYYLNIKTPRADLCASYPIQLKTVADYDDSWLPDNGFIYTDINGTSCQPASYQVVNDKGTCSLCITLYDEDVVSEKLKASLKVSASNASNYTYSKTGDTYYLAYKSDDKTVSKKIPVIFDNLDLQGYKVSDTGNYTEVHNTLWSDCASYGTRVCTSQVWGENDNFGSSPVFTAVTASSTATYTKFKSNAVYDGMVTVTSGHIKDYYYIKYIHAPRTLAISGIQGSKNIISGFVTNYTNSIKVCKISGINDELGTDNTFTFNDGLVSPTIVSLKAVTGNEDYNYDMILSYMGDTQTIHIKYTQSSLRFIPSGFTYNNQQKNQDELDLVTTVGGTEKIRLLSEYSETEFEEGNYWNNLQFADTYINTTMARYKQSTENGIHYLELWQPNGSGSTPVRKYEMYYEQIRLPENSDFTILNDMPVSTPTTSPVSASPMPTETPVPVDIQCSVATYFKDYSYTDSIIKITGPDATLQNVHLSATGKNRWDSFKYVATPKDATYTGYFEMTYKTQTRRAYITYTQK